ncbi:MAG: MAPEG family protein [Betaproteobacteria bacterium]|nr:MAPEG family protein [Betaproteobacteria bacterium]
MPSQPISPDLQFTALAALFTAILWIPIVVNRLREMGFWKAVSNPQPDLRPHADWAYRLANAHRNAIENLVVFAPLAIAVHVLGLGSPQTAAAAAIFFYSRVAHAFIYAFGIPVLRTIAFAVGFACQVFMAGRVLGWM